MAASDFSVAFYLRQPLALGNALGEAMRLGKANVKGANAILKRCIKSIWFELGVATIEYMVLLPDGTDVGSE